VRWISRRARGGKALALAAIMATAPIFSHRQRCQAAQKTAWSARTPCRRHIIRARAKTAAGVAQRQVDVVPRRCAVQRLGNVAAKSGVEMAFDAPQREI